MELRPRVQEVVTHLREAADSWEGLMPPCSQTGDVLSDSEESMSDSGEFGGFEIMLPRHRSSSKGTDNLFLPPDSPTVEVTSALGFGPLTCHSCFFIVSTYM